MRNPRVDAGGAAQSGERRPIDFDGMHVVIGGEAQARRRPAPQKRSATRRAPFTASNASSAENALAFDGRLQESAGRRTDVRRDP